MPFSRVVLRSAYMIQMIVPIVGKAHVCDILFYLLSTMATITSNPVFALVYHHSHIWQEIL
jgi:hypothetical protein